MFGMSLAFIDALIGLEESRRDRRLRQRETPRETADRHEREEERRLRREELSLRRLELEERRRERWSRF